MAMLELERIATEAYARWPGLKLAIAHRLGEVALGEAAVVIAVSTPHRAAAYEASRFLIEELKAKVPIWKKEIYSDGSSWTSNRP
jgi:molybdopterin synthase catalytic subunit